MQLGFWTIRDECLLSCWLEYWLCHSGFQLFNFSKYVCSAKIVYICIFVLFNCSSFEYNDYTLRDPSGWVYSKSYEIGFESWLYSRSVTKEFRYIALFNNSIEAFTLFKYYLTKKFY